MNNIKNKPEPQDPDLPEYRVVITLSHRLGGINDPWGPEVKVIGRTRAGSSDEAAAIIANKKVMDRIRVTIRKVERI